MHVYGVLIGPRCWIWMIDTHIYIAVDMVPSTEASEECLTDHWPSKAERTLRWEAESLVHR